MKKLLFSLALFIASATCFSQTSLQLDNGSSCDVRVDLFEVKQGSCGFVGVTTYTVPGGVGVLAVASPGNEFVHAKIFDASGNNCYTLKLDTDGFPNCVTCPGAGFPSTVVVNTACAGCQPTTTFQWDSQCSGGSPHLHMF